MLLCSLNFPFPSIYFPPQLDWMNFVLHKVEWTSRRLYIEEGSMGFLRTLPSDARAFWDLFTQALTNEKPTMLQFKIREALVVLNDSYDLRLQIRPYELNNSLISWEESYDASKNILIEEIQEVKIA